MTVAPSPLAIPSDSDCTDAFRAAYENRYTWEPGFGGYKGRCSWEQDDRLVSGSFEVGAVGFAVGEQVGEWVGEIVGTRDGA